MYIIYRIASIRLKFNPIKCKSLSFFSGHHVIKVKLKLGLEAIPALEKKEYEIYLWVLNSLQI